MKGDNLFLFFINSLVCITKCLVVPVSNIAFCEDGGDRIGCCKISLLFVLDFVLNNISAPPCHYDTKLLPY